MADDLPRWLEKRRFELLEPLGSGGTATVYRCRDHALKVDRAVKILKGTMRDREDLKKRLETEARVLASLNHPGLVPIFDYGQDQGVTYLVSELVDGDTLRRHVQVHGAMDAVKATQLMIRVLEALQVVHEKGVVHRDVKPSNILLDHDGRPRLIDFGIARAPEGEHHMTVAGMAMGTLAYMAPEQRLDASTVGPASDIHAVGASLYWLATAVSPMDLAFAPPDSPRWATLPRPLRPAIQRSMAREPDQRFASAADMARALKRAILELEGRANPDANSIHDATMLEVRSAYLASLRRNIEELQDAVDSTVLPEEAVRRLAHNLRGSGGSYGFPAITEAGQRVEEAPGVELQEELVNLLVVLRAVVEGEEAGAVALIVEDDQAMQALLIHEVQSPMLDVAVVPDATGALDFLNRRTPDVLVLNLGLPDADGRQILRTIRAMLPDLPIIVVAAPADADIATECLELGARRFLAKPLAPGAVSRAVTAVFRSQARSDGGVRPRVIAAEDDPVQALLLERIFMRAGIDITVVPDGASLLAHAGEPPDLYLLDAGLPDIDGFALLPRLRQDPKRVHVPVVFLTARTGVNDLVRGLEEGAEDYVTKPFVPAELLARVRRALRRR